jgi:hypothetical protein
MRKKLVSVALVVLSACGGGGGTVTGAVGQACMAGGREAASRALCSCVQRSATETLNATDQSRAAAFFADPQSAQDTRQSDRASDEAFWDRYQAFVARARSQCG